MNMNLLYYVLLSITVISYLIGLFLSQFEKRERIVPVGNGTGSIKKFEIESNHTNTIIDDEII